MEYYYRIHTDGRRSRRRRRRDCRHVTGRSGWDKDAEKKVCWKA